MAFDDDYENGNLTITRGKVIFTPEDAAGVLLGGIDLGNVKMLTATRAQESKAHFTSREGAKLQDAEIPLGSSVALSLTTDDMGATNRALWLSGAVVIATQTSSASIVETLNNIEKERWYQLGRTDNNPGGDKNITVASVIFTTGPTTYVAGVDYVVDTEQGMIKFLASSAQTGWGTREVDVTYGRAASTRTQIVSNESSLGVKGELKVISNNPTGPNVDHLFPRVVLKPSGDLSLIMDPESTEFQTMGLTGTALKKGNLPYVITDERPVVA
jgi:hypothetical protein